MIEISVVVPTFNRMAQLKRTLEALACQSFPAERFEVVVVSDGSTDGTNPYLASLRLPFRLVPVFQQNGGVAAARNAGFQHAAANLILFIDDDVVPDASLVEEHVKSHATYGGGAVVIGPMLTPTDCRLSPWVKWEQDHLEEYYHAMLTQRWPVTPRMFYTGNTSLDRDLLARSGGFGASFRRAEDVELAYRMHDLGARFYFNPGARSLHYAERKFESWMGIAYAYGVNDVLFTTQKGQSWLLPEILGEFHKRNPLVRALVRVCLDRPFLGSSATAVLRAVLHVSERIRQERASSLACSGIYNLRYFQGICDQLGGRTAFYEAVRKAKLV